MELKINNLKVDVGSGPGSRGGHVIGKTSSGKPIYMNAKHPSHGDFTAKDHREAATEHNKITSGPHWKPGTGKKKGQMVVTDPVKHQHYESGVEHTKKASEIETVEYLAKKVK